MSTRTLHRFLLVVLVCGAWMWTSAEVSTGSRGTIILGTIIEGPDPVGVWLPYRPTEPITVLNSSGHSRGDGRPDVVWKDNARPVAVWAYNAGSDFDIAFSEWDGSAWSTTEFLTSSLNDEVEPCVAIEADGTVHVVWWTTTATSEEIYLATRPAGSAAWDPPVLITGAAEEGRRPSVAIAAGDLRIAYERDSTVGGMAQDVMVATKPLGGGITLELVNSTARMDRLDVVIHSEQSHLWLDWKHEAAEFGCAEWQGTAWSPTVSEPWTDDSWVGVEDIRRVIRNQVTGP